MKILANDKISKKGINTLEKAGFEVILTKVAQNQLVAYLNRNKIEVLIVRSSTQVNKELIDACPSLKIIGRAGVGMDNIDVEYAEKKGIKVIHTPAASSRSVAELVFAHLFGSVRFLNNANRDMPLEGDSKFKELKKSYANGMELREKTLGIIGLGRIGTEVAKIALGVGMNVIASGEKSETVPIEIEFFDGQKMNVKINRVPKKELLEQSDFVSLHLPVQKEYAIGKEEIKLMKNGAGIINTSRGSALDEVALVEALDDGKLAFAALDVFEREPSPEIKILMNQKISLSPHIGGSTLESQNRISTELASQIIAIVKKN